MAKVDFSLVRNKKNEVEKLKNDTMLYEEIAQKLHELNEEHRKLVELPDEEFLSEETTKKLNEIHKEGLKYVKMLLNKES